MRSMCLIINIPAGRSVPKSILCDGIDTNPDGVGLMYAKDGRLWMEKQLSWDYKDLSKHLSTMQDLNRAVHFRWATHGTINTDNVHPFQIGHNKKRKWCMMHNGVLTRQLMHDKAKSDTWHFAQDLRTMLDNHPDLMDNLSFRRMLKDHIGFGNKMLFMDNLGQTYIINETAGTCKDGCWYSNTNSFYSLNMGYSTGHTAKEVVRHYYNGGTTSKSINDNTYISPTAKWTKDKNGRWTQVEQYDINGRVKWKMDETIDQSEIDTEIETLEESQQSDTESMADVPFVSPIDMLNRGEYASSNLS